MDRRPSVSDLLVGAGLVTLGVCEAIFASDPAYGSTAVQATYASVLGGALFFRACAPWLAIIISAGGVGFMVAAGSTGGSLTVGFTLYLVLPFALAMALRRQARLAGLAAVALLGLTADLMALETDAVSVVIDQIFIALASAGGYMVSRRERRLRYVHDTATARARDAVEAERARIARELHDIVGHGLSVMIVQADSARHALREDPDATRSALEAIERTGRESLADMRRLLGLLRDRDDPTSLEPQPSADDVPTLLDGLRDAGLTVDLQIVGTPVALSRGLGLTAYRIVQEALTNTVRHSDRARGSVTLTYTHRALLIEVTDDGFGRSAEPVPGRGLIGMEERARLYGGTVEVASTPAGWRVNAVLPLGGAA